MPGKSLNITIYLYDPARASPPRPPRAASIHGRTMPARQQVPGRRFWLFMVGQHPATGSPGEYASRTILQNCASTLVRARRHLGDDARRVDRTGSPSPSTLCFGAPIPPAVDLVLSHGPHGELLPLWQQVAEATSSTGLQLSTGTRRGCRISGCRLRSCGRLAHTAHESAGKQPGPAGSPWLHTPPIACALTHRMRRFRNIGDYDVCIPRGPAPRSGRLVTDLWPDIRPTWDAHPLCALGVDAERVRGPGS
jgi:hypothetical protein